MKVFHEDFERLAKVFLSNISKIKITKNKKQTLFLIIKVVVFSCSGIFLVKTSETIAKNLILLSILFVVFLGCFIATLILNKQTVR